ncbi:SGNH/GDSL hydrolase family protein [Ethanoligenens sp.]|uniref:SGNH/GDSL hydrolase family protein n=1 Tax=Ethanoligenens sp. TaxID=2099655 RepID=UPI0039EC202E
MDNIIPIPCRAVVCGDSISAGVLFDDASGRHIKDENGFVNTLKKYWNGSIVNLGKFGNTIGRALPRLKKQLAKETPDLVFIELGGNDCDFNWKEIASAPHMEHTPSTTVEDFERLLLETVQDLRMQGIRPVLSTLPPVDADRYFQRISGGDPVMAAQILKWLGSISHIYWWHERYNAAVLRVARRTGAYWVDLRGAFLALPDFRPLICTDGIHPNRAGQALIAHTLECELQAHCPEILMKSSVI